MFIYEASFLFLSVFCILLYLLTSFAKQQPVQSNDGRPFRRFQRMYLIVYLMAQGEKMSFCANHALNIILIDDKCLFL